MAVFALIHAAAVDAWYWHLLSAELQARGHDVVAVDLPVDDDTAGLSDYATTVVEAVGTRRDVVVVGHSFGGFTAPLVVDQISAELLVMLQAQIPAPGEAPGDWWANNRLPRSGRPGHCRGGRWCPPGCCSATGTGSCRWSSCGTSPGTGSTSNPT
ncbi:alpha/beta fold hydrolase [Kocuria sp. CPCC 205300]|uniref:alpha/beta fold hydrolase n=1 Tax=Kocuria sabuli TaxID=3071448 RepID=UPI0036D96E1E